jgi:mannitol/fructose-specific phosphotransferase system IIA component (Ntr-type)
MKSDFTEYLTAESVVVLMGKTKKDVLDEIISIATTKSSIDSDQLTEAVWKREKMMTTGIGQGLALPHVRMSGFGEPVVIVGVCRNPIKDYKSLDNEPIQLLVFLAASDTDQDTYLKLLGSISFKLKNKDMVKRLIEQSNNPKEIYNLLKR